VCAQRPGPAAADTISWAVVRAIAQGIADRHWAHGREQVGREAEVRRRHAVHRWPGRAADSSDRLVAFGQQAQQSPRWPPNPGPQPAAGRREFRQALAAAASHRNRKGTASRRKPVGPPCPARKSDHLQASPPAPRVLGVVEIGAGWRRNGAVELARTFVPFPVREASKVRNSTAHRHSPGRRRGQDVKKSRYAAALGAQRAR